MAQNLMRLRKNNKIVDFKAMVQAAEFHLSFDGATHEDEGIDEESDENESNSPFPSM